MEKKFSYNFSDLSFLERFKDTGLKFKIANDISVIEDFIDQDLKHEKLLQTNNISEDVYLYYNPFKTNYGHESVFNVMICNAYYYNQDIIFKIRKLTEEYKYYYNDKVINDFIDLFPYFKDYSKGFEDGYRNFEDDIKKRLNSYSKQEDFFDKIFEFVTNNDSWKKASKFISDGKANLTNGYDEGLRIGKFYKAWQVVFLNDKHFKEKFEGIRKGKEEDEVLLSNVKDLPLQPINVNESRTKKIIHETITNIDKQGWQYAFLSEQDYNLFTDLLTNFFEYKDYTLPATIIQLKRTCKTKVAKALGEIHKELSNENKLRTDTKYFELIRVLNHFNKETEKDLYKALTR